jgi:hypothetical protein
MVRFYRIEIVGRTAWRFTSFDARIEGKRGIEFPEKFQPRSGVM